MDLPNNERSFDLKYEGRTTGKLYEGQFTVKCILNTADKRAVELEKSALSADLRNPTDDLSAISTVVSNLRVRVIKAPDWFKQGIITLDIIDEDVFFNIYGKCLEKADEWLNEVKGDSLGEQKAEPTQTQS